MVVNSNKQAVYTMQAPAYMRIRQYVVDEVFKHHQHEHQILSERELCELFSVTRPTVRKALKDLIDDGYLLIRPGRGTFTNPAKATYFVHNKDVLCLGLIISDGRQVYYDSFYWSLLTGIGNEVFKRTCCLRIINLTSRDMKIVDEIKQMLLHGLIWICPPSSAGEVINRLNDECKLPVISINNTFAGNVNYVSMNSRQEGYQITNLFLKKGLRKIAYAGMNQNSEIDDQFIRGARDAFIEIGVPFNSRYVLYGDDATIDDLNKMIELGVEIQAVYSSARCLKGIISLFKEKQMVLCKDIWLATEGHNISTTPEFNGIVSQYNLDAIARKAAAKLIELINGSCKQVKELFNPELIIIDNLNNQQPTKKKTNELIRRLP